LDNWWGGVGGSGFRSSLEGEAYEEMLYEGYGPGGVALIIEALTDNKNRTVAEIRHIFSKHGGNLGENGWFNHKAQWQYFILGRFRAIENRRHMLFSANNGVTGLIDPWGNILKSIDDSKDQVLYMRAVPRSELTPYTHYADWFAWICVLASLLWVLHTFRLFRLSA